MPNSTKPIFYDEQRRRWKRLRRILDISAAFGLVCFVIFVIGVLRIRPLPELLLEQPKHNYRALNTPPLLADKGKKARSAHRRTDRKPSDVPLNTDEGLRAAYYVDYDASSYSSLRQHVQQIDLLFPEWLHVITPDGKLTGYSIDSRPFDVVDRAGVHSIDIENKVERLIASSGSNTEIFPLVNNFDDVQQTFIPAVGVFLKDPAARSNFVTQTMRLLTSNQRYHGLSLDFEDIPSDAQAGYRELIANLYTLMHQRGLRLYINVPVGDDDWDLKFMAANSDGLLLMNYDEHQTDSGPGPIASQDWFVNNLKKILSEVPKEKLVCAIGSYGYDWTMSLPPSQGQAKRGKKQPAPKFTPKVIYSDNKTMQSVWQSAIDSGSEVDLDDVSRNPHFTYDDEDKQQRHEIWFLDAVTTYNEMRAARQLGIQTFALWRLGEEDQSLWKIWDQPMKANPVHDLADVPPGWDLDIEGEGDVMHVSGSPRSGHRTLTIDDDSKLIDSDVMAILPRSYTVTYFGYHPKKLAISFDDGPDPEYTPRILDILKKYGVKGTFFMIGQEAEDNVGVMQRVYREGHEIGNHTFTHPDISGISPKQVDLQLNLTERLFAAKLGVQPLYFRPPYSIDQEPDTNDQAAPVERVQQLGYIVVGDKIDTNDWDEHPRKTPQEIVQSVLEQIQLSEKRQDLRGSIILMHDGGGDRSPTVAALPVLIQELRKRGYELVPVSALVGKTREQVMPSVTGWRRKAFAMVDSIAFFGLATFNHFVVAVFFLGDILMSARLIIIGLFALIDRFRKRKVYAGPDYEPRVAVLIPAYNEEKVIVRTIRSVMMSTYKNLRIIVIDDGSKDRTAEVAREAYAADIESGRLVVVRKENAGKAEALNYALSNLVQEEIYVGIDADTVIAHDAIARLVPHFANPKIGAVAGNAKVGNRVNLWTRWQALEYITSQNFERRALDLFDVVVVVPGAIGAWRYAPVQEAGGYHSNTVAEDADLTMILLEKGYEVIYEDQALAFTEAPVNANGLMRQRFRWSFGIMQAVFKHLGAVRNRRAMGLFALPNIIIFQILLPLVSPLIDLMFVASLFRWLYDRHFHPEAASSASFLKLLTYFLAFMIIDFSASALAFMLERKHPASKGDGWLLVHIWIQRFTYRQVFSVVLLKTVKRVIDGRPFSWDKLERTAKMSKSTDQMLNGSPSPGS
ncbi:polysaccharide deacetylase family protein [Terriglobus aquaticus]|uniref:Polysaccharide deacetylase family protein n=1 Tax=Terriglobus aquaticus TaxID=940139 RepID=A0ABW9KJR5_9BACT|nr:polysaccharide deacetylase family protein [Terriglobus aquaticus]